MAFGVINKPLWPRLVLPAAVLLALLAGWLTARLGFLVPGALLLLPFAAALVYLIFLQPRIGFIAYIVFCLTFHGVNRHLPVDVPLGLGMEALLLLSWLAILFHRSGKFSWALVQNDFCLLALAWFIINILEVGNPAGASFTGWFYEMRSTTLYWFLTVALGFMVFNQPRDLRLFLYIVIFISFIGALYGMKQLYFGVNMMEQRWLDAGAAKTHVLFGKLRVPSFYSEAAQFGSSQAHIGLVCILLAIGPFKWWKRLVLALVGLTILYGMLISGTRGAMFVLIGGIFVFLLLSKKTKILVLGSAIALAGFGVLKYTTIGNSNASIVRMRTSLDPNDASLQARLRNQKTLREYLASRPFGGGVGVIGNWGLLYNADKFLSTVPPDSYFVKIWAMYGIIGFIIWFGMMLYILGTCCGIVWNIRDPQLRQILMALTAGTAGILLCSYGNEILNQMPTSMIVYISWVFIFLGPQFDKKLGNAHA